MVTDLLDNLEGFYGGLVEARERIRIPVARPDNGICGSVLRAEIAQAYRSRSRFGPLLTRSTEARCLRLTGLSLRPRSASCSARRRGCLAAILTGLCASSSASVRRLASSWTARLTVRKTRFKWGRTSAREEDRAIARKS